MSVLTIIAGVPLYSTPEEALNWARGQNCTGYHVHVFQGQTGYMGCENHLNATGVTLNVNTPPATPNPNPNPTPNPAPVVRTSTSGGSSGGSSGGGY